MNWSLTDLYESFQCDKLKNDLIKLEGIIKEFKSWSDSQLNSYENPEEKVESFIRFESNYLDIYLRLYEFAHLSQAVDAKNTEAEHLTGQLENLSVKASEPAVRFKSWLRNIDNLDKILSSSELLCEHKFYIKEMYEKSKYMLSEKEELIISNMKLTGSNAWSRLRGLLTSTLLVDIEIDGVKKQLPLPQAIGLSSDENGNIRKAAYEAELKAYEKIEEPVAACLNGIKGEVLTTSRLRGYSSPLDMTLKDSKMDKETLDAMLRAIKESLPVFHKYFRRKAEMLGHENGLPFYDIFAPVGSINMNFSYDDARKFIVEHMMSFSPEIAEFYDSAFRNNWIDAAPKPAKRGGAFCSPLVPIKQSRILCTFTGSFKNVISIAHELGHAYHNKCLSNGSILNFDHPMPIAETASIFSETVVKNAAIKEADRENLLPILETSLVGCSQKIVDIYSRFLFEDKVFELRKDGPLSVMQLKDIMTDSQKKAYGDGLDYNYLHPYMWINKNHYYYPERNYYNFPYAFGLLFSMGLYARYLKEGSDFIPEYKNLLSETGKKNISDLCAGVGVDVHSEEFWRNSLYIIEKDINKFLDITD